MTVIAAIELHYLVALGEAAREADGGHAGLGAGIAHTDLLHAGCCFADELRHRDFEGVRNAEAGPLLCGVLNSSDNFGVGMAQDGWAPGADVVDVIVAIDVKNMRPGGAVDEERLAADRAKRPDRRVHATRDVLERLRKEGFRPGPRNHVTVKIELEICTSTELEWENAQ